MGRFFLGQHLQQKHHLNILFELKCIHHAHSNPASSSAVFNFLSCAGGGGGGHHAFGSGPTQVGGAGGLFAKGFALRGWGLRFAAIPGLGRNKASWASSSSSTFLFGGGYGGG